MCKHVGPATARQELAIAALLLALSQYYMAEFRLLQASWVVSAVWINMIAQGMLLSFTTSLLPALRDPRSPIRADLHTASWLSSSVGLAGIPGFLLSSTLMDMFGRRIAHGLVVLPGIIGWLLIYFATSVSTLMVGRVLGGITAGATVALGAIAIGEYTSPKYRGMFLNLKTASVCFGGMMVHILGNFYTWQTVAMCAAVPSVVSLLIIITWPESPAWLASKQEYEKCENAFYWLRGKDEESYRELEELIRAQMEQANLNIKQSSFLEKMMVLFNKFTRKDFLKPLFIIFLAAVLIEACGRHIFQAYALQIIEQITGSKTQSFYFTLCIDVIITASAVFSSVLVRVMKRRTLLFSTGLAGFVVLMTVCAYLFLAAGGIITRSAYVPIALFVLYFILVNLGCTPIPLALLGELFPLAHRGVGSAVSGIIMSLSVMMGLQMTPFLLESIKVQGTFAVLGCIMGVTLILMFITLPETKDRTLQEIEDYFNYGRFKERDEVDEAKVKMVDNNIKIVT